MYFEALFKKANGSRVSTGWPILDLIGGAFFLFIWFPVSLIDGRIKGRAANELLVSEHPIIYWFLLFVIFFAGVCFFYAFFKSYKKSLMLLEESQKSKGVRPSKVD